MKQTLLLLVFSAILINVSAQKKLKMEVDKQSGDTSYSTNEEKIYVKPGSKSLAEMLKTIIYKNKNGFMLGFYIQTGRTNVFTISKGSELQISLGEDRNLFLSSLITNESNASGITYGGRTYAYYRLTESQVQQLKSSPVSNIRIHTSFGYMDYVISEKFSTVISKQLERF